MNNPFDDLIPKNGAQQAPQQGGFSSGNPFADLVPASNQPVKPNRFIDSMESIRPNYVQKGMGNGQNGKRTFGDVLHNINEGMGDFAVGVAKGAIRTGVHLGQFGNSAARLAGKTGILGPDATNIGNQNNILNKQSAQGQYFDSAARGKTGLQKAGATSFDAATVFAPVGEIGAATEIAARGIPKLAQFAEGAGMAGKLARYAPKAIRGATEAVAGNVALTGGGTDAKDIAIGALTPALIHGAAAAYRGARALTREGRAALSNQAATDLFERAAKGDKFAIGKLAQDRADFHTGVEETLKANPNIRANKAVVNANSKLGNLENRTASQIPDYEPSDKDVIDQIWANGKLDGVGEHGRPITTQAQARQTAIIEDNAQKAQQLFESASTPVASGQVADDFIRGIDDQAIELGGKKAGTEIEAERRLAHEFIGSQPQLQSGAQATPGELFKISKALRDAAYKADGIPTETARANVYRNLAAKIDDVIFNNAAEINPQLANQLRKNQAVAYSTRSVLKALETTKIPGAISRNLARGLGYLSGTISGGGFAGGIIGSEIGERAASMLNEAYGNKKLASAVMQKFASMATEADAAKLQKLLDENVASNVARKSIKDYVQRETEKGLADIRAASKAQLAKNASEKAAKIKAFIESVIGKNKQLGAPKAPLKLQGPKAPNQFLLSEPKPGAPKSRVETGVIKVPPGGFQTGLKKSIREYTGGMF